MVPASWQLCDFPPGVASRSAGVAVAQAAGDRRPARDVVGSGPDLVLSGASGGIHGERPRIVKQIGVDARLVADGVSGPFTASMSISQERLRR